MFTVDVKQQYNQSWSHLYVYFFNRERQASIRCAPLSSDNSLRYGTESRHTTQVGLKGNLLGTEVLFLKKVVVKKS